MTDKPTSEWQTQELTQAYLEGVRGAIPGADMQHTVIAKIADLWVPSPAHILDLGCGDGILGRFLLGRFPSAKGLLLDFSDPMLDAARHNAGSLARATIEKADFSSPQWVDVAAPHGPFDLVVSGFAIHHLPDARKRTLYAEIFHLLSSAGLFLNLEHVASATEAGEQLFDELFIDHLYAFHSQSNPEAKRDVIAKEYHHRPDKKENQLVSVEVQCQWLRQIGYADVDCFFKVFELALFGGKKAVKEARLKPELIVTSESHR